MTAKDTRPPCVTRTPAHHRSLGSRPNRYAKTHRAAPQIRFRSRVIPSDPKTGRFLPREVWPKGRTLVGTTARNPETGEWEVIDKTPRHEIKRRLAAEKLARKEARKKARKT